MPHDAGLRVFGGEFLQQLVERVLLGFSAGVSGHAVFIETALVHDAEATVVVVAGMDALDAFGQQWNNVAIAAYVVVVRALAVLGFATGYQVFHAERDVALVGHAVDNNQFNRLQWFHCLDDLEPVVTAALHCDGTQYGGDDSGNIFQDFSHFGPVDSDHIEHGLYGFNG